MAKLFFIIIGILSDVLYGWVVSLLWRWFIVPLGVRPMNAAQGLGLALMVSLLTKQHGNDEDPDMVKLVSHALAASATTLVIGFVVHLLAS